MPRKAPKPRSAARKGRAKTTARGNAGRKAGRKAAAARTPKRKPRKRAAATKRRASAGRKPVAARPPKTARRRATPTRARRATGSAATPRRVPNLERPRRRLREIEEEMVPTPPSSLDLNRRRASAARSGRKGMRDDVLEHNEVSPEITAGDVDADWQDAYAAGDEAPGGDNPTPDQDRVDDIGRALGIEYQDNEELKAADKISARDKHRWELDSASAEDYPDHEN